MASVQTNSYDGRYLKLTVVEESTSVANNTSTLRWTLESIGGSVTYYTIYNCSVVVNGTTVANYGTVDWSSYKFPAKTGSVSGTVTVGHNDDGTASPVSFTLHGKVYYSGDDNKSGTVALSTIPRYFTTTPSITCTGGNETQLFYSWSTSEVCQVYDIEYKLTSQSAYTRYDTIWCNAKSGTFTISGLTANTYYDIRLLCRRKDSQMLSYSNSLRNLTYNIPHITSTPNVTIGDTLTVKFYNPLSRTVKIQLYYADGTTPGYDVVTGTSLSGWTLDRIQGEFYKSIPNSKSGRYKIRLVCDELGVDNTVDGGIYSIRGTEIPTFNNFTYIDTNTAVSDVIGTNQVLVKGLSRPRVIIEPANKMVANYSAIPKSYTATIDNLNKSANYSNDTVYIDLSTVTSSGTKRLSVTAYDSRTLYKEAYKDVVVMDYSTPVINASVSRLNNFEAQTTLKVAGTYTRLTYNNADKNTITNVQYRYREVGGTWSSWTQLNTTVTAGRFTCSDVILSLDNTKAFEFELQAIDKLTTGSTVNKVDIGQAIFFISTNNRKCYINGQDIIMYDVVDTW